MNAHRELHLLGLKFNTLYMLLAYSTILVKAMVLNIYVVI